METGQAILGNGAWRSIAGTSTGTTTANAPSASTFTGSIGTTYYEPLSVLVPGGEAAALVWAVPRNNTAEP
jgi:hypothetical protein